MKTRASCLVLSQWKRPIFALRVRDFRARDLLKTCRETEREREHGRKIDIRFLRVGTMVWSHEGTGGNADCAVAVRAIQNRKGELLGETELARKD